MLEVNRTRAAERRKNGKTDRLDAYRAARSVLAGDANTCPKNDTIEPLRALSVTRRGANKALQACWRQLGSLLVNAPTELRENTAAPHVRSSSTRWRPAAPSRSTTPTTP